MTSVSCDFCNATLSDKSALSTHYKSKKCREARENPRPDDVLYQKLKDKNEAELNKYSVCISCKMIFGSIEERDLHKQTCLWVKVDNMDRNYVYGLIEQHKKYDEMAKEHKIIKTLLGNLKREVDLLKESIANKEDK